MPASTTDSSDSCSRVPAGTPEGGAVHVMSRKTDSNAQVGEFFVRSVRRPFQAQGLAILWLKCGCAFDTVSGDHGLDKGIEQWLNGGAACTSVEYGERRPSTKKTTPRVNHVPAFSILIPDNQKKIHQRWCPVVDI